MENSVLHDVFNLGFLKKVLEYTYFGELKLHTRKE